LISVLNSICFRFKIDKNLRPILQEVIRHNNAEGLQLLGCACPVFTAPSVAGCIYVFLSPFKQEWATI